MLSGEHSGVFATLYNPPASALMGVVSEVYALKDGEPYGTPLMREESPVRSNATANGVTAAALSQMPIFQDISFDELWMGQYQLRTYVLPRVEDTALASGALEKAAIAISGTAVSSTTTRRSIPSGAPASRSRLKARLRSDKPAATATARLHPAIGRLVSKMTLMSWRYSLARCTPSYSRLYSVIVTGW